MRAMLSSRRQHHVATVNIFLVLLLALALIAGIAGCGGAGGGGGDDGGGDGGDGRSKYNPTMVVAPAGSGTATDLTNASPYAAGAAVSIKAIANPGYEFVNWTAPVGTFANPDAAQTTFTMPAQNVVIKANFFQVQQPQFEGGSGTAGDPYQIAQGYQLNNVRNYLNSHFILVSDIDLTIGSYTKLTGLAAGGAEEWQPIGTEDAPFTGTFNGKGQKIEGLVINLPDEEGEVGFFGVVGGGGLIENVELVNVAVTGFQMVGGLVGWNEGTVRNCYVTGAVNGQDWVGGLVGGNEGSVGRSYATCAVHAQGRSSQGGWIGGWSAGGLVGDNYGTVSDSYATGTVTGVTNVGGLVGFSDGTISGCYATGAVSGESDSYVGGLVGNEFGSVSDSFWDVETSGTSIPNCGWDDSGVPKSCGTGKTTAEMRNMATFSSAGWSIIAVANTSTRNGSYTWNIVDGQTYPFLSWEPM